MTPRIRLFRSADRTTVRRLALETADRGRPAPSAFWDRKLLADLLTRYYTDVEPESLWVAERDGAVVGYLTGCLDSRRRQRWMRRWIVPCAVAKAVLRGAPLCPEAWRLLRAGWRTARLRETGRAVPLARYPAHLHLNLSSDHRRGGLGRDLIAHFLDEARAAGVPGVHLRARADNVPAQRFFRMLGFRERSRYRWFLPEGHTYVEHTTCVLVKPLD